MYMQRTSEKGSALVLVVILLAVLSVMTVSMMYLSQSETWSTQNYKLMNLARDAAEAGLNKAVDHIQYTYTPPQSSGTDLISSYTYTSYPVQTSGSDVFLLAPDPGATATYPDTTKSAAFAAAGTGMLSAGNLGMTYKTKAELLSMKPVGANPFTGSDNQALRWKITSTGSINGVQGANVEVSAILDQPVAPVFPYGAFGTSDACPPSAGLSFAGNTTTDSYDSSQYNSSTCGGAAPSSSNSGTAGCGGYQQSQGNVGSNGYMEVIGGSAEVNGTLSTPRAGVGACAAGYGTNSDITSEGITTLPGPVTYPTPPFPTSPAVVLTNQAIPNNATTCPASIPAGCTATTKNHMLLAPGSYGNLSGGSATVIHLEAGTYTINSIDLGAQTTVQIDSGPVILNIAGCATLNAGSTACATSLATPIASTGGGFVNSSYDSGNLQITYAGSGTLQVRGNFGLATTVYAPNAMVDMRGTTDLYGAVIGHQVDLSGTPGIHYDRALGGKYYWPGQYMLQNFTWSKF